MARSVLLVSMAVALAACGTPPPPSTPVLQARLTSVAWIAGHWKGDDGTEELWMEPAGGTMLGTARVVQGADTVFFEYLRLVERPDGTVVYVASPKGTGTTDFALVEADEHRAVFENPAHDFPQRIVYALEGDQLTTRVSTLADATGNAAVLRRVP